MSMSTTAIFSLSDPIQQKVVNGLVAPEFSPDTHYQADELAIHRNKLYFALVNVEPGEWDPSEWQQTTLSAEIKKGDVSAIIISAESHTTKEGYEVPVLTDNQIIAAYNGIVAGNNVFVVDDLETITIQVFDASSIDDVAIRLIFTDALILTYHVGGEIDATGFGGEASVDDITIGKNQNGELIIKDGAITNAKINSALKATSVSSTPSGDKFTTEQALYNYIASGNSGYPRALDNIDLNTVISTGFYSCNVCTNRPTENNGAMIVIRNTVNTNTLVQIYLSYAADEMWIRHRDNSIWKNWVKVLKSGEASWGDILKTVIDIGSNQYVYDGYSLPAIPVDNLKTIYANHKANVPQVIKWTLLGSETYLAVISTDYIASNYSIDILVHNRYHCQYTWDVNTTGTVNPEVNTDAGVVAPAFSTDTAYSAGELVIYDKLLYRAKEYVTAGEWDATEWEQTTAGEEIAQKYIKPNAGIPKIDLASDVQSSLDKADSALQEHQSLSAYRTATAQDDIDAGIVGDQSLVDNFSYEGVDLGVKFAADIAAAPYNGDPAAWIKGRIAERNYKGLHLRDYFTITCLDGTIIKPQIMGINTYKGSSGTEIGDHIDFISKDCWPGAVRYNPANYNNGIGLDKFTGDGATTAFQLCHRTATAFPELDKVTVGGADAATDTYNYDAATGILTFNEAPASSAVIKAVWATPIGVPFLASEAHAFLMSEKAGVPNEAAADPTLIEVDYTNGGVWNNIPNNWKAVIVDKVSVPGVRYTIGTLRTSESAMSTMNLGKLWLLDECEIYGCPKNSSTYANAYGRIYPGFLDGNRRKGDGNGGARTYWWTLSAHANNSKDFCFVYRLGYASSNSASATSSRVPVCFRITD